MLMTEFSETEIRHAFHGRKPEFAERKGHTTEIRWRDKKVVIWIWKDLFEIDLLSYFLKRTN